MLKQTSNVILLENTDKKTKILNETSLFAKNSPKAQSIDAVNTIKIDFSKMSKLKSSDNSYTQCDCGWIVTVEDKKEEIAKEGELFVWSCRACKQINKTKELHFCENNYKTILQKNIQRGFLPPIIIFLIDNSGSMGESVSVELDNSSNSKESNLVTASRDILQIIKTSSFSQKQMERQSEFKEKYQFHKQKDQFKKTKIQGSNYYSKITLFMSFIENYLNKLKSSSSNIANQFRVGFIFFNEFIHILKPTKQKIIPVIVPQDIKFTKEFPFEKQILDFNDYDALFNAGKKFERFFGDSRLKTAELSKLMVQYLQTQGTTALGPALAVALGIASVHDIGSRIVIVSDSLANRGILSSQTKHINQDVHNKIRKFIEQRQITIGVLNWITDQPKSYQQRNNNEFIYFLHSDKERIKQICLDFSLRQGHVQILNTAKRSLQNLMNRGSIGSALSIKLLCSNLKTQITKFKYEELDFRSMKFLGLQSKNWVQLKPKKVTQQDFLFPIYTQIVVIYEDVFTKQKYLFMSYVKHKLIGAVSQKDVYEYLDISNKNNLEELIDMQKLSTIDRDSIIPEFIASKTIKLSCSEQYDDIVLKNSASLSFSLCDSLNYLADLENKNNEDDMEYL